MDVVPMESQMEIGGSDGARSRDLSLQNQHEPKVTSHIHSHIIGIPDDLQEIIESWLALSPEIRAAVLAIIKSAKVTAKA
jgi:hypothetical protein